MGRVCQDCNQFLSRSHFSSNQLRKPDYSSRCSSCINGGGGYVPAPISYQCHECNRTFNTQNELNMHAQVHRARNVACPLCGDRRFRSGANAVQHIETGSCTGCSGVDNARTQIYQFARQQRSMGQFMTDTPMLEYGGGGGGGGVPDYPYQCRECSKVFRNMSQLLQHQDNKHNNSRMLTY